MTNTLLPVSTCKSSPLGLITIQNLNLNCRLGHKDGCHLCFLNTKEHLFFFTTEIFVSEIPLRIIVGDPPLPICVPILFLQEIVLQLLQAILKKKGGGGERNIFKAVKVNGF